MRLAMSLLFGRQVTIDHLTVDKVQVIQKPAPVKEGAPEQPPTSETKTASTPPDNISLPLQLDLKQLQINTVIWGENSEKVAASQIAGSYRFDGDNHQMNLTSLHVADGDYRAQATLRAQNPQLDATLNGMLRTQVPESTQTVDIEAQAKISGLLTELDVQANAQTKTGTANGPKAQLHATVMPWSALMVPKANLDLQAFNANAFWVQAPQTLLSGTVVVTTSQQGETGAQQAQLSADLKRHQNQPPPPPNPKQTTTPTSTNPTHTQRTAQHHPHPPHPPATQPHINHSNGYAGPLAPAVMPWKTDLYCGSRQRPYQRFKFV